MRAELTDLLIHKKTKSMIDSFLSSPSHGLLIVGEVGSGKRTLALAIAAKLLDIAPSALDSYPYFTHLYKAVDDKEVSIDTIRELIKNLGLKTVGSKQIRRVILIEDAHNLSHEAQNSLLKILEEPSNDTVFIISTPSEKYILPTIVSRAQIVTANPVSLEDAVAYYSKDTLGGSLQSQWQLSRGNVGLLTALLNDTEPHLLKDAILRAKLLLKQDPYERLLLLDSMTKDKPQLMLVIEALSRVITSLHHSAVLSGSLAQQKRLLDCRQLITSLQSSLNGNANHRLAMMHLAMNLSV